MDKLRGLNPINLTNNKKSITFQITDWVSTNEEEEVENDSKNKYKDNKNYVIRAFGVTKKGTSVSINIHGFPPHYYINIPETFSKNDVDKLVSAIKFKLPKSFRESITSYDVVRRKKFWGFTNNKMYSFLRILFKNTQVMFQVTKIMKDPISFLGSKPLQYDLYETNISPFLRFIHINNLLPAGWVKLQPEKYTINEDPYSTCQLDCDVFWKDVTFFESEEMAPFITASFDIEADSSHGDFPLAKKNYKKLAGEILDVYQKYQKEIAKQNIPVKERREFMTKLLKYAFVNEKNEEDISYVFTKASIKPNENIITSVAKN